MDSSRILCFVSPCHLVSQYLMIVRPTAPDHLFRIGNVDLHVMPFPDLLK
jgi:hypothetical protein